MSISANFLKCVCKLSKYIFSKICHKKVVELRKFREKVSKKICEAYKIRTSQNFYKN